MPHDTDRPGSALAARLKAELDARADRASAAAHEARRHAQTARARRDALMADLRAFARSVGHFRVWSWWGTLRIRHQSRTLTFTPRGDAVVVTGAGVEGCCRFEERLARWVFQPARGPSVLLFDRGLSVLVEQALGVRPSPEPD